MDFRRPTSSLGDAFSSLCAAERFGEIRPIETPFRNHLMSIGLQKIPRSLSNSTADTIMRSEDAGGRER